MKVEPNNESGNPTNNTQPFAEQQKVKFNKNYLPTGLMQLLIIVIYYCYIYISMIF